MRFHKNLIMNETACKNRRKIIRRLKRGRPLPDLYVLMLPATGPDQLEICAASLLLQPALREQDPYIVGFSYGYEAAVALIQQLTEQVYKETGTGNIRDYIESERS